MFKKAKVMFVSLMVLTAAGLITSTQARVTEKVDAMIAENSPLKVNDTDLWVQVGGPLVFGIQYDKFATANVAIGGGVGTYINGLSLDLALKYYFLTGKFSPFISGGPVFYYSSPKENIFAMFGSAGLSYYFADGLGVSLAFTYVKSLTESEEPFSYYQINDKINWPSAQLGIHWNF